ncbi:MAG: isochorismatase family protein [Planctomycetota bacterium]|nr:isochorismatase family protein [Planctomycetota bacterium]
MFASNRNPFAERLTPENSAVLLIDHQVGLFSFLPSVNALTLKNNILGLAKTAKHLGLPTILTTSWPHGPNGPTMPELVELFPDNLIIDRNTVNFWDHPPSVEAVRKLGRKKLIIAALDTTTCLAMAAVYGVQAGYDVYAVVDASSTFDSLNEQAAMLRMASAGVVVTTWVPVLAELCKDTTINGKYIAGLLTEHTGTYYAAMNNYLATGKTADAVRPHIAETVPAAGRTTRYRYA